MGRDVLYIFDKLTSVGSVLGEIQTDFNMGLTLDGTKDSMKVVVHNYSGVEIEPYSIIYHPKTETWWCVSHDKVNRYAHESGFYYIHELELNGAIELLNARDLTDCGFNDKTYTFRQFIQRLFRLSSYSFLSGVLNINCTFFDLDTPIEFIKTFENYTLLSALREFLDAFNMDAKLSFELYNDEFVSITNTILNIIPKTGSSSFGVHNIDDFNDVRETKTIDKNSFGACVVSNAENVISSASKTYPSVGAVRPISKEYVLKAENAILKLPSKVFKLNWLKLVNTRANVVVNLTYDTGAGTATLTLHNDILRINAYDDYSINEAIETIRDYLEDRVNRDFIDEFMAAIANQKQRIVSELKKVSTITLYDDFEIEPVDSSHQNIIKRDTMPYIVKVDYWSKGDDDEYLLCTDKTTRENLLKPWSAIYWERGSDEIAGFDGFEPLSSQARSASIYVRNLLYTDLQENVPIAPRGGSDQYTDVHTYFSLIMDANNYITITTVPAAAYPFRFLGSIETQIGGGNITNFIVNYIPMSDIKIKVDNTRDKSDIQLYNQNGKMTDGVALSKLINSYSKEISSDNITRYAEYQNYSDVPKVGSIVNDSGKVYVVNSVSMTFVQIEHNTENDDYETSEMVYDQYFGYFIEAEISMSQYCSTKSLMVSPNTNIRDYGIPQNYNVKRKQLYRDFYELNYSLNSDSENVCYLHPRYTFTFGHYPNEHIDFICLIQLTYEEPIEGQTSWYYQLETTRYNFNKMFYVVLDFKDNNIIGYSNQNVYSGFVISRVFSGQIDTVNTPISYVDDKGQFKNITILWVENTQLTKNYYAYMEDNQSSQQTTWLNRGNTLYNYSVFIPQEIYDYAYSNTNNYRIITTENNYNKDALEVPIFEYACQFDDTTEVLIGDNLLKQYEDPNIVYFYSYVKGTNLGHDVTTDIRVQKVNMPIISKRWRVLDGVNFQYISAYEYGLRSIEVSLFEEQNLNFRTRLWEDVAKQNISAGYDYAIFRHAYNLVTDEEIIDLLFVAKNVPSTSITNYQSIIIKLNHYKLN